MITQSQDRDALVTQAIGVASEEERAAYIAQACGDDAELKRQVEEQVAAHFQSESPADPVEARPPRIRDQVRDVARKHPRVLATAAITLLLLLIAAVVGTSLAVWALRKEGQARKAEQEAVQKNTKAEKAEAEAKGQLHLAAAARKATAKERDRTKAAEEAARRSEEDTKAVLAFFQDKLFSAGRPANAALTDAFWAKGQDKNVTLRQAVDGAESQIADAFADRPLGEASIREMLGSAYLNLGEAARAVKQYERALALREAMQGVNDPDTADCRNKLAVAYRVAGRTTEAGRLFDQNYHSAAHASALAIGGSMLLAQKKPAEAELKLRACLTIRQKIQPNDWTTFDAKSLLGEALLEQKKYADAEALLRSGYEGMKQQDAAIPSRDKPRLTKALERLVHLYQALGKKDEAAKWQKELEAAKTSQKP